MNDTQWEYCVFLLTGMEKISGGGFGRKSPGYGWESRLVFMTPDGNPIRRDLTDLDQPRKTNPYYLAFGQLGVAGWELVTIQGGTNVESTMGSRQGFVATPHNGVLSAYFKRPRIDGRPIDDVELVL